MGAGPGKETLVELLGNGPPGPAAQPGPRDDFDSSPGSMIASSGRSSANAPASGKAGGSSKPPDSSPAAAPPDLGNYDSEVGKHVIVLRSWDDKTIAARRVEMQGLLSRTLELKARDKLLREYEAIEWVARERNLALPKDPGEQAAPQAHVGGKPTKFWAPDTAQGGRAMLEREMAEGTGYGAAKDRAAMRIGYATTQHSPTDNDKRQIGDEQGQLMDHDAAAFRAEFRIQAKQTALSMLDASSVAVDTVLQSYGIAGGTHRMTDAARKVAANPDSLDAEVETWLALSQRLDSNQAALAAGHGNREALAKEAQHLRDLQDSIAALSREQQRLIALEQAQHPQHAGMPRPKKQPNLSKLEGFAGKGNNPASDPFELFRRISKPAAAPEQQLAFVQGALKTRQDQFRTAWINAERAHPVLAAYRAGKPPDASTLAGIGSDEGTTRSVIKQVLPKLGNIVRTKAALLGQGGTLDPLQLAPVVELTKQRMFVAEGSYRDRAVHDMVEQAHDKEGGIVHWAFQAVLIGLTMLTLVPTGGTSAMAALSLAGLAYDIYAGLDDHEDFKLGAAAADTDLDKVRSLSDTEPSLTPLLMRIVSAGVNFTIAASLFKRATALRQMTANSAAEREALAALNKAGEELGVKGIGDEAIAGTGAGAKMPAAGHHDSTPGAHHSAAEKAAAKSLDEPDEPAAWLAKLEEGLAPDEVAKLNKMKYGKTPVEQRSMFDGDLEAARAKVRAEVRAEQEVAATKAQSKVRVQELKQEIADKGLMRDPEIRAIVDDASKKPKDKVSALRDKLMAKILKAEAQAMRPNAEVIDSMKIYEKLPEETLAEWKTKHPGRKIDGLIERDDGLYMQRAEVDMMLVERNPDGARSKILSREEIKTGVLDTDAKAQSQLNVQSELFKDGASGAKKLRLEVGGRDIADELDLASDAFASKSSRGPALKGFDNSLGVTATDLENLSKELLKSTPAPVKP